MDYRDRQWQHDFMPKAVKIISRSVISSLDTATRSQYELPADAVGDFVDPAIIARGVVDTYWKTYDPDAAATEDDMTYMQRRDCARQNVLQLGERLRKNLPFLPLSDQAET
jgi:hypothetical protein